jgi:hypothetical protein
MPPPEVEVEVEVKSITVNPLAIASIYYRVAA